MALHGYRIYLINCPGRLLNFWTLRVGTYLRWALIWGWVLIKFSPFSTSVVCIFCKKTVSGNNKMWRCNKARFLQNTMKKTLSLRKSQISPSSFFWVVVGREWALIWVWVRLRGRWGGGGGGCLFKAGHLLTCSAFRMGAYSRWALIQGWALIQINNNR